MTSSETTTDEHPWRQRLGVWWIAEEHPDLPAIAYCPSGVTLSFAELARRAHQLVHALRSRGLVAGDTIAYDLPNDVDMIVWQLATQESGLRSIALNPSSSAAEIRRILEHSGAVCLVLHERFADRVPMATESTAVRIMISVRGPIAGFEPQDDLVAGHPTTMPEDRRLGGPSQELSSCPSGRLRLAPLERGAVYPDTMEDHGNLSGDGNLRLLHPDPFCEFHSPGLEG